MKLYEIGLGTLRCVAGCFCLLAASFFFLASALSADSGSSLVSDGKLPKSQLDRLELSGPELAYLKANPVIRYTCDPAWPPFSFVDASGRHNGIDADLLALLAERLGVVFQLVPAASWQEAQDLLEKGLVDFIPGVADLEERRRTMLFTDYYASIPVAVIVREDAPFQVDLVALSGMPVSAPRDYVTTSHLQARYPDIRVVTTNTPAEAMELVSRGVVEATIENLASASYIIKTSGFTNLKIGGVTTLRFEVRLAVRQSAPLLASALNKSLNTVSEAEHFAIKDRWISANLGHVVNWGHIIRYSSIALLIFLAILGVVIYWNRKLSRSLAERQRVEIELRATHLRLQNLNEEKSRFLEIAAHDLKSPLTGIVMASDLLQMENALKEPRHLRLLGQIRHFAERMNKLIETLLRTNALDTGLLVRIESFDIIPILDACLLRYEFPASTKHIELKRDTPARCFVQADQVAIDHVVENLLSNAIKFSPPKTEVTLSVQVQDADVIIVIRDQGPGIREEEQELLFRRHVTLSPKPTGVESSSGLGLSLTKQLVEKMNGRIWYERVPAGGSIFRVALPKSLLSHNGESAKELVSR